MIEVRVCLLDRLFYGLILLYMRASCYGSEKYRNKMIEVRVCLLDRLFYGLILLYMKASCYGSENTVIR